MKKFFTAALLLAAVPFAAYAADAADLTESENKHSTVLLQNIDTPSENMLSGKDEILEGKDSLKTGSADAINDDMFKEADNDKVTEKIKTNHYKPEALQYFTKAVAVLNGLTESAKNKNELLINAISDINKALEYEPENSDYLLAASQLYRQRGGASYAQGYFAKAEAALLRHLRAEKDSIYANIDYAAACYIGDMRFTKQREEYYAKAQQYAKKTLVQAHTLNTQHALTPNEELAIAVAYLILGNEDKCKEIIAENSSLSQINITMLNDNEWNRMKFLQLYQQMPERAEQ